CPGPVAAVRTAPRSAASRPRVSTSSADSARSLFELRHERPHRRELLRPPARLAWEVLPGQGVVVLLRPVQQDHVLHGRCLPSSGTVAVPLPGTSEPPGESGHRMSARAATVGPVRVATWNVNSVRQRVPRRLPWLDQRQPDVVCFQDTKPADSAFTDLLGGELDRRGYAVALHGQAQWNGVAILSRAGLDDVITGIPGGPGFPEPEARAVSATCGGVRGHSGYVPHGRGPDPDHHRSH